LRHEVEKGTELHLKVPVVTGFRKARAVAIGLTFLSEFHQTEGVQVLSPTEAQVLQIFKSFEEGDPDKEKTEKEKRRDRRARKNDASNILRNLSQIKTQDDSLETVAGDCGSVSEKTLTLLEKVKREINRCIFPEVYLWENTSVDPLAFPRDYVIKVLNYRGYGGVSYENYDWFMRVSCEKEDKLSAIRVLLAAALILKESKLQKAARSSTITRRTSRDSGNDRGKQHVEQHVESRGSMVEQRRDIQAPPAD